MRIVVYINTNHNYEDTRIEDKAIHEFTTTGFAEGTYDADVKFSCMPAAVEGNALTVIIEVLKDVADYGEMIFFYASACKGIYKFLNKCYGYKKSIVMDDSESISHTIDVSDNMTEEELEAKVFAILELERKKIGEDVIKIMK